MKINLNTRKYEVEFIDGEYAPYAENIITETINSCEDPNHTLPAH